MPRRVLLQLICIFTLLVAQFGALTHAVWHAPGQSPDRAAQYHDSEHGHGHGHGHGQGENDDHSGHSPQGGLCGLHALLATVLGCAATGAPPMPVAVAPLRQPAPRQLHCRAAAEAVPFLCRGPPAAA